MIPCPPESCDQHVQITRIDDGGMRVAHGGFAFEWPGNQDIDDFTARVHTWLTELHEEPSSSDGRSSSGECSGDSFAPT